MDDDQEKAACVSLHVEAEGASGESKGVRVQVAVIQRLRGPGQREGQGSKLRGLHYLFGFGACRVQQSSISARGCAHLITTTVCALDVSYGIKDDMAGRKGDRTKIMTFCV